MTTTILIIVNVFAALAIIVLALMQQSKGDMGSAFGGGGSQSMFGSRGSANFLSRLTATMCVVFFVSSLALAWVYAQRAESRSVVTTGSVIEQSTEVPALDNELPSIDTVPATDSGIPVIGEELPLIEASETDPADVLESTQEAASEVAEPEITEPKD